MANGLLLFVWILSWITYWEGLTHVKCSGSSKYTTYMYYIHARRIARDAKGIANEWLRCNELQNLVCSERRNSAGSSARKDDGYIRNTWR
jgi:hypothetical protein